MIKHDDKEKLPVAETENGAERLKPHSGKFFRLGVFCLIGLMLFVLLMVGGSASKIISKGTISGFTWTAEGFEIEASETTVTGETYDDYDLDTRKTELTDTESNDPYVICSFEVTNNSNIDALLDVVITTNYSSYAANPLDDVSFYLCIGDTEYKLHEGGSSEGSGAYFEEKEDEKGDKFYEAKLNEDNDDGPKFTIIFTYDSSSFTVTVKDYPLKKAEDGTPVTIEFIFVVAHNGSGYPNYFALDSDGDVVSITAKQA